ncbi:MAG TPA: dihydropteroate synthase [Prolixibacteraceae bacterium]|nr:dihydropteroate synthase [Prolixibacteraceae bacterium]
MLFTKNDKGFYKKKSTINLNGKLISLSSQVVMGILNVTPDSFYDGGAYTSESAILKRAAQILKDGGQFIDIGAMSTRPGAVEISLQEELDRLMPAVRAVKESFPETSISVDTYRSKVVKAVFNEIGGFVVNDISGGTFDPEMFETVGGLHLPYILMHSKGKSEKMQNGPVYEDVLKEVILFLATQVQKLKLLGVCDIIVDPGFGFGKTAEHNYDLLNHLNAFKIFELPILVGVSRKAMIWNTLDISPDESLNGTTVLNTLALAGGCDILRVHDVKEAVETIKLIGKIKSITE